MWWTTCGPDWKCDGGMIPTISQVCSLNSPFRTDVADYAAGQCRSIEFWFTKLEDYLNGHSVDQVHRLLEEHQMQPGAASIQGGVLTSQGAMRDEAWALLRRRLELCRELSIPVMVVACDPDFPLQPADVERVSESLRHMAEAAEGHGVRVALEFQSRASLGNNLQTAVALTDGVGSSMLGICLDVFHFFAGPSKYSDLAYLSADNLFHVQVCDVAGTAREMAVDANRILPGDGDIPLDPIVHHLHQIHYDRCVSLELMNPQIWQVPPLQLGEIGMTALRKLLGQARM